jgi:hypothetical protein
LSLRLCAKRFGKCERVYTDRGAAATAWRDVTSCEQFLDEQLIDHSLRKAHRPQGGGKIESVIGTVQRELWEVVQFDSVEEAERALVKFLPTIVTAARTWGSAAWCPPGRMGRGRVVWLPGFRSRDAEIRASSATHARRPRGTARSLRACPVVGRGRRRVRPSIVRLSPSTGVSKDPPTPNSALAARRRPAATETSCANARIAMTEGGCARKRDTAVFMVRLIRVN